MVTVEVNPHKPADAFTADLDVDPGTAHKVIEALYAWSPEFRMVRITENGRLVSKGLRRGDDSWHWKIY